MELEAEEKQDKLLLRSENKHHTTLNLVKDFLWDVGAEAGYEKGHPYVGSPGLVIAANDPESAIQDAVERAKDKVQSFRDAVSE